MDIQSLALLLDQQAKSDVDARLYFTMNDGAIAQTTANTKYSTDPLKDIRTPLEALMVVPTDPPSDRIQLIGGHFYANGKLYPFPGMQSEKIRLDENKDTYCLVGVRIDPRTDSTTFYCGTEYGEFPFFDPSLIPAALIKIPAGHKKILSQFIMDLRPFIHYNVSTPEDRVVINLACISPKESVAISLRRNMRLPPILSFYQKVPPPGVNTIVHNFSSEETVVSLNGEKPFYDEKLGGLTIKKRTEAIPVDIPTGNNVLVVSPLTGNDMNPGTDKEPLRTVEAAVSKLNVSTIVDTIFVKEGIYAPERTMVVERDVAIIGTNPLKCIFRLLKEFPFMEGKAEVTFRTLQFQWAVKPDSAIPTMIQAQDKISFYNCIFRQASQSEVIPWCIHADDFILTNCIVFNPFGDLPASKSTFYQATPSAVGIDRFENSVVIGPWNNTFPSVSNIIYENGQDALLEDLISFYPKEGSPTKDAGIETLVGSDTDGTAPDIGLYGGKYAAMQRVSQYPLTSMPVFKYHIQTMFSPVIQRFVSVTPLLGYAPPECKVYGAVSFDGGHTWLGWDENNGAWRKISDLNLLHIHGNLWDKLSARLVQMGPIPTKGEICFAWGLRTGLATHTPVIKGVKIVVKASGSSLTPIPMDKISALVAEDTVLITNQSDEQLRDMVIVAY